MPSDDEITADVCVVGGGPAGLTVAATLRGSGLRVVVVESGGSSADALGDRASITMAKARSTGHSYFPVHTTRVRGLGGTSNHWYHAVGFRARPLDPLDFEARPGIPHSGWPMSRADLDPWYEQAHVLCGLGPFDYEPSTWANEVAKPALDLGPDVVTSIFQLSGTDAFIRLGAELCKDDETQVLLHGTVTSIECVEEGDAVARLRVTTTPDHQFSVRARRYVVAAGGIDTPRLLLASTDRHPRGVGNGEDLVGRYFMEHLSVRSGDWRRADRRAVGGGALYSAHTTRGVDIHAKLSPAPHVVRAEGLLNVTFFLDSMTEARASRGTASLVTLKHALVDRPRPGHLTAHAFRVARELPQVGRVAAAVVAGRVGRPGPAPTVVQLRAMSEQTPNPESRVTLDDRRDALGLRRARLQWRLTDLDRHSVRRSQEIVDHALRQAGLGQLDRLLGDERPPEDQRGQWHHMGTTRMSVDPRHGVVDHEGRVHGMRNLYLAGSSVFPTVGYANPTLTVVALALRLAAHLRDGRGWE